MLYCAYLVFRGIGHLKGQCGWAVFCLAEAFSAWDGIFLKGCYKASPSVRHCVNHRCSLLWSLCLPAEAALPPSPHQH